MNINTLNKRSSQEDSLGRKKMLITKNENGASPNIKLGVDFFTNPNWRSDKVAVERILTKSSSSFAEGHAKRKLNAMENKQRMLEGTISLVRKGTLLIPFSLAYSIYCMYCLYECDIVLTSFPAQYSVGISKLQTPLAFTYPELATDAKLVYKHYLLGDNAVVERLISQIEFKQMLFDGNRSDPFIVEMDDYTFTYPGWEGDKTRILQKLSSSVCENVQFDVRRMLKGMENKQRMYEEQECHPVFSVLNSGAFSYSTFKRDKHVASELFERGDEGAFEQLFRRIQDKQKFADGDRSHLLLVAIDNANSDFTYPHWKDDLKAVEETLMHSVNSFAEYDARRLYNGMQNRQRMYTGNDLDPGIATLKADIFSYSGFKRDQKDAINEYRAGYDSAFKKRLSRIQEKQKLHDVDRASPVLISLDRTTSCSPKKSHENAKKNPACESQGKKEALCPPKKANHSASGGEETKMDSQAHKGSPAKGVVMICKVITKNVERFVPDDCVICLEAPRTHIFSSCGHLALCNMCAFKPPVSKKDANEFRNFLVHLLREFSSKVHHLIFRNHVFRFTTV